VRYYQPITLQERRHGHRHLLASEKGTHKHLSDCINGWHAGGRRPACYLLHCIYTQILFTMVNMNNQKAASVRRIRQITSLRCHTDISGKKVTYYLQMQWHILVCPYYLLCGVHHTSVPWTFRHSGRHLVILPLLWDIFLYRAPTLPHFWWWIPIGLQHYLPFTFPHTPCLRLPPSLHSSACLQHLPRTLRPFYHAQQRRTNNAIADSSIQATSHAYCTCGLGNRRP